MNNSETGTVFFRPKKIFGQSMLKTATLEINNSAYTVKFGKEEAFQLPAGNYDFECYSNYMGKKMHASGQLSLKAGEKYEIKYKTNAVVFLAGKVSVNRV